MRDFKYLLAYITPLSAWLGMYLGGAASLGAVYVAFVAIPIVEFFTPGSSENHPENAEPARAKNIFFDFLLYLNLPIFYALIGYYFYVLFNRSLSIPELVGMTLNMSVVGGTLGINVAHELGHRAKKSEQFMSKALLLPALYMHFFIEHNRGHHKNVATVADPASSRFGENVYAFWWRSVKDSYADAWTLERERLQKNNIAFWSVQNEMLRFQVIQLLYLSLVGGFLGWKILLAAIAVAIGSFLLLECVNYIEHYGLERKMLPSGAYERVTMRHSWNSNHEIGRIFLYELTRHADHHYKSTRPYQVLRHYDESPQLPFGYPASMLLSLAPPLWFAVMNKKVEALGAA